MHLLIVSGDGDVLLGIPDIMVLNILQISCNTVGTKKKEKGANYKENETPSI